jgi:Tfp pilus assembly protein FimT
MMIVVAIIGILASVILPSLDSAGAQSLQAVARVLAADLQLARSYAIQNNSEYSVTFDFANSEYEITHTGSGTHAVPENPMAALSEADGTYVVNLSQMGVAPGKTNPVQLGGVALRDSKSRETEIAFGPLGGTGPIRNEDTVIWLTETSSGPTRYVRLIVSWVTGQVWMDGPEIFDSSDTNQLFR